MSAAWPVSAPLARRVALGAAGLGLLVVIWWALLASTNPGGMTAYFTPKAVFCAALELLSNGALWPHVRVSLERIGVGLVVALLLGVPLGVAVGTSQRFDRLTSPAIQFLRMISPISWMPLAVMLFGVGDQPIWFLLAFAATWPILLNTAAGVRALNPRWLELGMSFAATRRDLFFHIVAPGIVAHVLTGVRLAIGVLWIVLVPAEMLGVNAGLGYCILNARDRLAYSELAALVLIVGGLGFLLDAVARWLSRAFHAQ